MSDTSVPIQECATVFRAAYQKVFSEIGKVIVGHADIVARRPDLPVRRRPCAARRRARPGQDAAGADAGAGARPEVQPHSVHARPDAVRHHRHQHHQRDAEGKRAFSFQPGPLFAQIVLADEINRATPKTQSALLEAMQEHSVTVGGTIHKLEEPFFVMATQNPIEQEGTYPLPEAQLDRFFFKLVVNYSGREEMATILDRTTTGEWPQPAKVMDGDEIRSWQQLVREVLMAPAGARLRHPPGAGHAPGRRVRRAGRPTNSSAAAPVRALLRRWCWPAKVRALLEGRYNVSFDDIRRVYLPALRHRILLNFEAQAENIPSDAVLTNLLKEVKEKGPELAVVKGLGHLTPIHPMIRFSCPSCQRVLQVGEQFREKLAPHDPFSLSFLSAGIAGRGGVCGTSGTVSSLFLNGDRAGCE